MKKTISLILSVLLCLSTLNFFVAGASVLKGDANNDGNIDLKDVLTLRKHYVGLSVNIDLDAADYNNDTKVNLTDILLVRRLLAGLESRGLSLPLNYKKSLSNEVQVNQTAYETTAEKTAKLCENSETPKLNSMISSVNCYLVDKNSNSVVFSDVSTARRYDSVTDRYVSTFDFSKVTTTGKYAVYTPNGYSYTFEIKNNPYDDVENALITALYYNRCGCALSADVVEQNFTHDVCHSGNTPVYILNKLDTNPSSDTYNKYIQSEIKKASDFSGGLHDAGDYGRYTIPANQVVADLLMTYEMYGKNIDCKKIDKTTSDLLLEAKYEMQWLLKMQNKATGGVYWRIATKEFVAYGNKPDEDTFFNNTGLYVSHETLKATAGFVGAAAMCARTFKTIDASFANECLTAAKLGYAYVKANMNDNKAHVAFSNASEYPSVNAGEYGDNPKAWGEIWWAACALYRATGEATYNNDLKDLFAKKKNQEISFTLTEISAYQTGGAGSFEYLNSSNTDAEIKQTILSALTTAADKYLSDSTNDKYNNALSGNGDYQWGSNQILCVKLKVMAIVDYINHTTKYENSIRNSICYILGRNAVNKCFVTGYGSDNPKDICHAPSAYLRVKYNLFTPAPGFMVGGAFQSGSNYEDVHDNYACNEVCVYWNSSAVLAFGYIVNFDKNK